MKIPEPLHLLIRHVSVQGSIHAVSYDGLLAHGRCSSCGGVRIVCHMERSCHSQCVPNQGKDDDETFL